MTNFISALQTNRWTWFAASSIFIFIITFSIYSPGLSGGYEFDDSVNIEANPWLDVKDLSPITLYRAGVAGSIAGPLKRPISMASFAVNRYLSGADPYYMKVTNVFIHALNGVGLFLLSLLLLKTFNKIQQTGLSEKRCHWMALAIAVAWVAHPLTLTSTLYIVQRMTSLSALFTILGMIGYVWARKRSLEKGTSGAVPIIFSLLVFSFLGAYSKENGLLLPLFAFVIEACLFRFQCAKKSHKQFLYGLFTISLALPVLLLLIWITINPDWLLNSYQNRQFNLAERIMTQARVLWFYLQLILIPDITQMGIYHDDFSISRGLLSPWNTLLAIVGLIALIALAAIKRKLLPVFTFGVFFFLAGHTMESTIISLELVHEHRNYLPMFGVIFAIVFYVFHAKLNPGGLQSRGVIVTVFILLLVSGTAMRSDSWGNVIEHSLIEVQNHPSSGRALYQAGRNYWLFGVSQKRGREENYLQARSLLLRAKQYNEYKIMALISLIHLSFLTGLDMEKNWLDELEYALKHERLPVGAAGTIPVFVNCHIARICKLDKEVFHSILNHMVKNPSLIGSPRAVVLSAGARYMASQQEYAISILWLREAADLSKGQLRYRLMLINLLIERGEFNEARKQIGIAGKLDHLSVYQNDISMLKTKILEMQN